MSSGGPKSKFNLEEIEAFEALLEQQEQDMRQNNQQIQEEEATMDGEEDVKGMIRFEIPEELHHVRLDAAIAALLQSYDHQQTNTNTNTNTNSNQKKVPSRSQIGHLITGGFVHLQPASSSSSSSSAMTTITKKAYKVEQNQTLLIDLQRGLGQLAPPGDTLEIIPENIPLDVIYEDEHMIVLNKAAGMVVHPAAGNWNGTLVNALAYYLAHVSPFGPGDFVGNTQPQPTPTDDPQDPQQEDTIDALAEEPEVQPSLRPGIVHRLDKGTTGVIVVAKTKPALSSLSQAFAQRKVRKTYLTVTVGNPGEKVVIDKPIGRHPVHRQKMRVVPPESLLMDYQQAEMEGDGVLQPSLPVSRTGRRAVSYVDTLASSSNGKLSVVQVRIETGRTHQIRVHLQDRHTPVYGDDVYGIPDWNRKLAKGKYKIERPLLHAFRLDLQHPVEKGKKMRFQATLKEDMAGIVDVVWPEGRHLRPEMFRR